MTRFAEGTSVSVSRSRIELEELLAKWKADRIASGIEPGAAVVAFSMGKWHVRFRMPMPTEADAAKQRTRQGYALGPTEQTKWLDQQRREKWRALVLTVKAKLVSVENGVESFEEAFLAHLVLPGGGTMGQLALPVVAEAYSTGKLPALLPGGAP